MARRLCLLPLLAIAIDCVGAAGAVFPKAGSGSCEASSYESDDDGSSQLQVIRRAADTSGGVKQSGGASEEYGRSEGGAKAANVTKNGGIGNAQYCLPSQNCWPSAKQIDALNVSLKGEVHAPLSTTQPEDDGYYANIAMEEYLPALAVHASSADDVKLAIKFADTHNIRVVVKNLGHSYRGESAGLGALMIYTRGLWEINVDESYMSCGDIVSAMKVGGGVVWGEVYEWMVAHGVNYSSVGGSCVAVSATGGWLLGSGLNSQVGRMYGLGVDNVLEYEVVLPSGDHVRASACSHPDLFRVLRGGGGGAWGVIISARYKVLPPSKFQLFVVGPVLAAESMPLFTFIAKHAISMDHRWQINEFATLDPSKLPFPNLTNHTTPVSYMGVTFMGEMNELLGTEFYDELESSRLPFRHLWAWDNFARMKLDLKIPAIRGDYRNCNAGMRIIPRSAFEDEAEVANLMQQVSYQTKGCGGFYHVGGAVFDKYQEDFDATYVNPKLRTGVFVVNVDNHSLNDWWLAKGWTGTSINHQSWGETNWQENAWGLKNYAELLDKKHQIDPKRLFHCRRCVGWTED